MDNVVTGVLNADVHVVEYVGVVNGVDADAIVVVDVVVYVIAHVTVDVVV